MVEYTIIFSKSADKDKKLLKQAGLDEKTIEGAIDAIMNADTLIVVGTSLTVYPAASFVRYLRGNNLILLNKSHTQYDSYANIAIHDDVKNVIEYLEK